MDRKWHYIKTNTALQKVRKMGEAFYEGKWDEAFYVEFSLFYRMIMKFRGKKKVNNWPQILTYQW